MPGDDTKSRTHKLRRCSFCGKPSDQVRRKVAGPKEQRGPQQEHGQSGLVFSGSQIPAPAAEQMSQHTKHQRKGHPAIIHAAIQHAPHTPEIKIVVCPKQNSRSEYQRKRYLEDLI